MLHNLHVKTFHFEGYNNSKADSISTNIGTGSGHFSGSKVKPVNNTNRVLRDCIRAEYDHLTLSSLAPNTKLVYSNGLNA